jgi:NAD-dependent dihydropyrimidine dehydrogenase PreA subunit
MSGTPKHEPMVMVKELCIDCAVCREVCPYTAVFFVPTKWKIALQVDQQRCTGCGGPEHAPCVQFCPSPGALVPASALLAGEPERVEAVSAVEASVSRVEAPV